VKLGYLKWKGRCTYCGCGLPSEQSPLVVWVPSWDEEGLDPICESCRQRRRLRPLRRTLPDPTMWQPRGGTTCHFCGTPLPSPDTTPATIWAWVGIELVGVCNACRLEHDLTTEVTTVQLSREESDGC
jgi:hypothetical protein